MFLATIVLEQPSVVHSSDALQLLHWDMASGGSRKQPYVPPANITPATRFVLTCCACSRSNDNVAATVDGACKCKLSNCPEACSCINHDTICDPTLYLWCAVAASLPELVIVNKSAHVSIERATIPAIPAIPLRELFVHDDPKQHTFFGSSWSACCRLPISVQYAYAYAYPHTINLFMSSTPWPVPAYSPA